MEPNRYTLDASDGLDNPNVFLEVLSLTSGLASAGMGKSGEPWSQRDHLFAAAMFGAIAVEQLNVTVKLALSGLDESSHGAGMQNSNEFWAVQHARDAAHHAILGGIYGSQEYTDYLAGRIPDPRD